MRRLWVWPSAVVSVALLALLVLRWRASGFGMTTAAIALVVLFGLPVVLWLWLERRDAAPPRRVPRMLWAGIGLVVAAFAFQSLGLAAGTASSQLSSSGAGPALRFAPVPAAARRALAVAFPSLTPRRALTNGNGPYEIWLGRPGAIGYAFQVSWSSAPPQTGAVMQAINLQWNTAYEPRSERPLSLEAIRQRVRPGSAYRGPYLFPGYVLYVSLSGGVEAVVDRVTGQVVNMEGW